MGTRVSTNLPPDLRAHMEAIKAKSIAYGLDFFEVVFEVVDFDTMNQLAAYGGFPVRYPHWRWGMEYESMRKRDAYGLGRIYEMVINNDPCYAYLQESNAVVDQKLVMAHVYGHADFFKNNLWFSKTDRKMMDRMANHATRVRRHIEAQGAETVERFLDACLSLEHLIDPHSMFVRRDEADEPAPGGESSRGEDRNPRRTAADAEPDRYRAKSYMDPFINPPEALAAQRKEREAKARADRGKFPKRPTRDVLLFLLQHAPLAPWQHDVLSIIRDEAYYFAPQGMTKIMNEGWASYWHAHLMTRHFADATEIVDYADKHAGVVHTPPGGFNPYKIGLELFRDIEKRWDTGQHGPAWERLETIGARHAFDDRSRKGREKIFEVRRVYNDVSFIDEFLTEEFCDRHKLFRAKVDPGTGQTRVASRDFGQVKQALLQRITNAGQPFLYVVDGNYLNRGELYLAHRWTGAEVEVAKGLEALRNLRLMWGRPVHLQARVEDEQWLFSIGGPPGAPGEAPTAQVKREKIKDGTPAPAHQAG